MANDVLVVPHIGGVEHESDIDAYLVDNPVHRKREVACIVENIDGENPNSKRHSK